MTASVSGVVRKKAVLPTASKAARMPSFILDTALHPMKHHFETSGRTASAVYYILDPE